ncbi:hypothetical protein [Streptacidiphilus anmyonensis]|uniref:hypothetical protein n=1 Tax=Streptacidiphilus anmyonensis TaxID=405782 RepID=UPI000A87A7BE|nr:hypothetical protein [Streptacidiphilus anmyonensis]
MIGAPTPDESSETLPETVLSLQETPAETDPEAEVVAHFSGGSFLVCTGQN